MNQQVPLSSWQAFDSWIASLGWPMAVFLRPEDFAEIRPRFVHVGLDATFGEYFCCGHTKVFSKDPHGKIMDFSQNTGAR